MAGTAIELKNAIAAALAASPDVTSLVGDRIYEYAQTGEAEFPFIALDGIEETDDSTDCLKASDAFVTINGWSKPATPSFDEAYELVDAIRAALHQAELTLATNRCVLLEHATSKPLLDSDPPPVYRARVTFHAIVEEM